MENTHLIFCLIFKKFNWFKMQFVPSFLFIDVHTNLRLFVVGNNYVIT